MPQIREISAGTGELQPSDLGAEAYAQVGRRSGQFFHQAGQEIGGGIAAAGEAVQTADEQAEIAGMVASGATLANGMTQTYNNALKDPNNQNDPDFAQKFLQGQALPAVQQWQDQFHGAKAKAVAQQFASGLIGHMNEKIGADQMTIAGIKTTQSAQTITDQFGSMVASDPSSVGFAIPAAMAQLDAMLAAHPEAGAEYAAKFDSYKAEQARQLAHAAVIGAVDTQGGVPAAQRLLQSPDIQKYLRPGDQAQLQNMLTTRQRMDLDEGRRATEFAESQANQAADGAFAGVLQKYATVDQNGREVLAPGFLPALQQSLQRTGGSVAGARLVQGLDLAEKAGTANRARASAQVAASLLSNIGNAANPTTPDQVTKAIGDGTLPYSEGAAMLTRISGGKVDVYKKVNENPVIANEIAKVNSMVVGNGDPQNQAFVNARDQQKADALRTIGDAAARGEDPSEYYNPSSPKYLFTPQRAQQYTPSKDEVKNGIVARNLGQQTPVQLPPGGGRPPLVFNFNLPAKGQ